MLEKSKTCLGSGKATATPKPHPKNKTAPKNPGRQGLLLVLLLKLFYSSVPTSTLYEYVIGVSALIRAAAVSPIAAM